jgi:hypothetical protein
MTQKKKTYTGCRGCREHGNQGPDFCDQAGQNTWERCSHYKPRPPTPAPPGADLMGPDRRDCRDQQPGPMRTPGDAARAIIKAAGAIQKIYRDALPLLQLYEHAGTDKAAAAAFKPMRDIILLAAKIENIIDNQQPTPGNITDK